MSIDAYLEVKDIPGQATDSQHKNWIDVDSYSIQVKHTAPKNRKDIAAKGKSDFGDLEIKKRPDVATPLLFDASAKGNAIDKITLELCTLAGGGNKLPFLKIFLTNSLVTKWDSSVVEDEKNDDYEIVETVCFNYETIEIHYSQQTRAGGKQVGQIVGKYDLINQK